MNLIQKVRSPIQEHQLLEHGAPVVIGVSGGPDSLTLLRVLRELAPEFELTLHVAHLNHQLRGAESDADAEFVANLAREWGLAATVEARDVSAYARGHQLSIEEAARVVRYQFLTDIANRVRAHIIAVAHNADDQIETILMHFLRGAGLAGLRGMSYKSNVQSAKPADRPMFLIRPLLDVTRIEIEAYCHEQDLLPRLDQSNLDTAIFRNRLRHEVIPYLEQLNPNLREVLRNSARSIADDYEYLHAQMEDAFMQVAHRVNGAFVFDRTRWRALPSSLQRATLREAVRRLREGLRNINWQHIEAARRVALDGETGAETTLPQHLLLIVGYDDFTIGETMPLPDIPLLHVSELKLHVGEIVELPESAWAVKLELLPPPLFIPRVNGGGLGWGWGQDWIAVFDADKICGELMLRTRRAGERFEPSGLGGKHKSLHEFMIDAKIAHYLRDYLPILADDEKILWVCGYRVDERLKVTPETKHILKVDFFKNPTIA